MPGQGAPSSWGRVRRRHSLRIGMLALATGWLFVVLILALATRPGPAHAGALVPGNLPNAAEDVCSTPTPPAACTPTSATPTYTPTTPTTQVTPTTQSTSTAQATDTSVAATPFPTDTPASQPTRAVFSQPTLGTTSGSGPSSFSPENVASYGLVIFTSLGCVLGVIGLSTLAFAGFTLSSDGWGPVIKAVLLGNRRGRRRFDRRPSGARPGVRASAPRSRDERW
jgi:hypothetical protein